MPFPPGTRVYLACQPIDMRKGMYGLTAEVTTMLHADPYSGQIFVFRGRRGDYVKVLHWDGSGLCLYAKRLEAGRSGRERTALPDLSATGVAARRN